MVQRQPSWSWGEHTVGKDARTLAQQPSDGSWDAGPIGGLPAAAGRGGGGLGLCGERGRGGGTVQLHGQLEVQTVGKLLGKIKGTGSNRRKQWRPGLLACCLEGQSGGDVKVDNKDPRVTSWIAQGKE